MPAQNQPGCGPCCVTKVGCSTDVEATPCGGEPDELGRYDGTGCLKCIPRYLCMRYEFTPSAYSDHCPATGNAKLFYTCQDNWVSQPETIVLVGVTLYRQQSVYGLCECFYRVAVSVGTDSETYEGIPLDELHSQIYGVTTDDGEYDVTIGAAGVIRNPLAFQKCAPCVCATCLPASLLVSIEGIAACPAAEFCQTVSLCETGDNSVTFELPEGDVTVTIVPSDDGGCSLDVTISATFGNLTGDGVQTLGLESVESEDGCDGPPNLVECREVPDPSDPLEFFKPGTRGGGSCAGHANIPLIDSTFSVLDDGIPAFTVRVRDAACATCASGSPTCNGACASLESYGLSCTPPDLTAAIVSTCKSVTSVMAPQETKGTSDTEPAWPHIEAGSYCQAFHTIQRLSPTSGRHFQEFYCGATGHQFSFLLYYIPLPCSDRSGPRPERYRLAVRITSVCKDFLEEDAFSDTAPVSYSCDPPMWEFHTGITWGMLYGSLSPCLVGLEKCCPDNQDDEIIIRIML